MKQLQLKENFWWIGTLDKDLRVFDIIMETKYGTTYNAYCLQTGAGLVLFESVKDKFFDEFIAKISTLGKVEDIAYIVVDHTEPDHSGSIEKLLALNPKIKIISSLCAQRYLKEITNRDFDSVVVKDGERISVGEYTLRFISVPNLHWPDTMYTFIEELGVLVTCDSFGAHYASDEILLSKLTDHAGYEEAFAYYTTMIMGPFKTFVAKAMEKLQPIQTQINLIAPGHGLVIDQDCASYIKRYQTFATGETSKHKSVVIPYVSAYGYTKQMALKIQEVLKANGISCEAYDLVEQDETMVVAKMIEADGILYGCPTLLNDALPPIYHVMNSLIVGYHGQKLVSAFGSYGWSGEAVGNMLARLKQQRMKVADEGLKICFKPNDAKLRLVEEYAQAFADKLLEK
ncbi:MAG: FprA family A-type flavoprotein [Erysipelotrichaceae bacterium]|nr:FprA family A-type flavoprotein [Erysipelotrichaceae bacterium]MDY5251784.1 FprA family A-type flavoprotein [Erysipelotrichaceae bacterium]